MTCVDVFAGEATVPSSSKPKSGTSHQSITTSVKGMGIYRRASYCMMLFISSFALRGISTVVTKLCRSGIATTASLAVAPVSRTKSVRTSVAFSFESRTPCPMFFPAYGPVESSPYVSSVARSIAKRTCTSFTDADPISIPSTLFSFPKKEKRDD